jgi:hypothetical protein
MDRQDGTARVVGALEHGLKFEAIHPVAEPGDFGRKLGVQRLVGVGVEQFGQTRRVVEAGDQLLVGADPALEDPDFVDLLASAGTVSPE